MTTIKNAGLLVTGTLAAVSDPSRITATFEYGPEIEGDSSTTYTTGEMHAPGAGGMLDHDTVTGAY